MTEKYTPKQCDQANKSVFEDMKELINTPNLPNPPSHGDRKAEDAYSKQSHEQTKHVGDVTHHMIDTIDKLKANGCHFNPAGEPTAPAHGSKPAAAASRG